MLILFYWRTVLVVVSSSAEAVVVSFAEPNFYKKGLKKITNFVVVTNFTFFFFIIDANLHLIIKKE